MTGNFGPYFVDLHIGTLPHHFFLVPDIDIDLAWLNYSTYTYCFNRKPKKMTHLVFLATGCLFGNKFSYYLMDYTLSPSLTSYLQI
ncbi:aspartic proteinase nepenthesin-1 [Pyrus ussuriensis x Pyrus communis]|uniref:Aspartic proteinase nepenthesin-1 n=1 Tax=Pyrus ussuriensis x Pyrus communis TaxID=2448454 RepID=A0A5N5HDN4_9ROSA|nr:aspartic proteinase nepenthesin-1 [Pyrus ussuriensis x Pyrus communis]